MAPKVTRAVRSLGRNHLCCRSHTLIYIRSCRWLCVSAAKAAQRRKARSALCSNRCRPAHLELISNTHLEPIYNTHYFWSETKFATPDHRFCSYPSDVLLCGVQCQPASRYCCIMDYTGIVLFWSGSIRIQKVRYGRIYSFLFFNSLYASQLTAPKTIVLTEMSRHVYS